MNDYKILITSTLGKAGNIVSLPPTDQTRERLKKGIVCEVKVIAPMETKRRTRKAKG